MSNADLIARVHKLLRLANSPNANEAASAAAMAQRLIDEHNLAAALLEYDGASREPEEPIIDFSKKGAPLDDSSPTKLIRWRAALSYHVSKANGCRTIYQAGVLHVIGRPSDVDAVRYLYSYLVSETERLCKKDGAGCGRTWKNNYRLGVVDTIARRLKASHDEFELKQRSLAQAESSTALVRMNAALMKIDRKVQEVDDFMSVNMKLRKPPKKGLSQGRRIQEARKAGQEAGESIQINSAKAGLAGQKGLTS